MHNGALDDICLSILDIQWPTHVNRYQLHARSHLLVDCRSLCQLNTERVHPGVPGRTQVPTALVEPHNNVPVTVSYRHVPPYFDLLHLFVSILLLSCFMARQWCSPMAAPFQTTSAIILFGCAIDWFMKRRGAWMAEREPPQIWTLGSHRRAPAPEPSIVNHFSGFTTHQTNRRVGVHSQRAPTQEPAL